MSLFLESSRTVSVERDESGRALVRLTTWESPGSGERARLADDDLRREACHDAAGVEEWFVNGFVARGLRARVAMNTCNKNDAPRGN